MYYPNSIEQDICYKPEHMEQILVEIKLNFSDYFQKFLETEAGAVLDKDNFNKLAEHFGSSIHPGDFFKNAPKSFKNIVSNSETSFQKDRDRYLNILDPEMFEEYQDDPSFFKNTVLRDQCPIIRATLQNRKAKELDKFRKDFNYASPNELLKVVSHIVTFANEYIENVYDESNYLISTIETQGLSEVNKVDYVVYGVIGGGIRSQMLYKLYPCAFPNRSREAIWALWFLTNKRNFGCEQDSEFLMINVKESTTQQNYFYPYDLFAYYVLQIYKLIQKEADKLNVYLSPDYRYVIVHAFLNYVAHCHEEEINLLRSQLKEESYA